MKKQYFLILSLFAVQLVSAQDWGKFGLNGVVRECVVTNEDGDEFSHLEFTESGRLTFCKFNGCSLGTPKVTAKAISGNGCTLELGNGRVTRMNFSDGGAKCSYSFYYDADGYLDWSQYNSQQTVTTKQTVSTAADKAAAEQRAKKLLAEMQKPGLSAAARKAKEKEYKEATKIANSSAATKTVTKSENVAMRINETYYDYEYDVFGNWTSRWVDSDGGMTKREFQVITYSDEFLCDRAWAVVEISGDVEVVEEFFHNTSLPMAYREKALALWWQMVDEAADEEMLQHFSLDDYVPENYKNMALERWWQLATASGEMESMVSFYHSDIPTAYKQKALEYCWQIADATADEQQLEQFLSIDPLPAAYRTKAQDRWWGIVSQTADLDRVEVFFAQPILTPDAKGLAQQYWNERILDEVAKRHNNAAEKLTDIASRPICSESTRQKALDIARSVIYETHVMPERDYAKLRLLAESKEREMAIFNQEYRQRILARADQLYADSVANQVRNIDSLLGARQYEKAQASALQALAMAPDNTTLAEQRAEAEYRLLRRKKAATGVLLSEYDQFRENNPGSKYDENVATMRRHQYNRENRGSFCHLALEGEASIGTMLEYGGGLGLRFGWNISPINLYAGVQYNSIYSTADKNEKEGGNFSGQYLTVPLQLRFTWNRNFGSNAFLAVGANISFPIKGKLGYQTQTDEAGYMSMLDHIEMKDLYQNSTIITPRVGLGFSLAPGIEIELYGLYEKDPLLNEDVIREFKSGNYIFNDKVLDQQLSHKFRIGAAFRLVL